MGPQETLNKAFRSNLKDFLDSLIAQRTTSTTRTLMTTAAELLRTLEETVGLEVVGSTSTKPWTVAVLRGQGQGRGLPRVKTRSASTSTETTTTTVAVNWGKRSHRLTGSNLCQIAIASILFICTAFFRNKR